MNIMKCSTNITLYNSYFDINDHLTPKSILGLFQDVASIHAEKIGVGYKDMLTKNLYWVLSRVKYDIVKMPQVNQTVVVSTWPQPKGRIDFDREFLVTDQDGEVLIKGTSKWCVINTSTRSLQRTDDVNYIGNCITDTNYTDKFLKITLPETQPTLNHTHTVMFTDLDHNKHMNNTNYANLVSNVINVSPSHFEINYITECVKHDQIEVYSITENNSTYIMGKVDNKICFTSLVE